MARWKRFTLIAIPLAIIGGLAYNASATDPPDPRLASAATAVQQFADGVDRLSELGSLAQQVPLTTFDPRGADGLDLAGALHDALSGLPSSYAHDTDLRDALEGLESTTAHGASYYVGCQGTSCTPGTGVTATTVGNTLSLSVPIHVRRTVAAPLAFSAPPLAVSDGTVSVQLGFDVTLPFTIDLAAVQANPGDVVTVAAPLAGSLTATFDNSAVNVVTNFGFTTITVGGTVHSGGLTLPITFADPDNVGGLSLDEFTSTAIDDVASNTLDASLDADVTVDTPITPASPDATIHFATSGPHTTALTPTIPPGSLDILSRFTKVTPEQVLGGVGQLASAVQSVVAGGDVALPFLHEGLASLAGLAQPVVDFVSSQSVTCGTTDSNPPSGGADATTTGLAFFCQATAAGAVLPGSIHWHATNANAATDGSHDNGDGTVAPVTADASTRHRARFTTSGHGPIAISADYTLVNADGSHTDRHVSMAPLTAQDLLARLASVAGFDASGAIAYDDTTRALTVHLVRHIDIPAPGGATSNATFDFGDKLKAATGVFGVSPRGTASVKVGLTGVTLDLTFGILLVDSDADVDPDATAYGPYTSSAPRGPQDRFFVGAPSGHILSIDDASVTANVDLGGRLGFVDIGITGSGGSAFSITKPVSSDPMLAVDLHPGTLPVRVGGVDHTIANAVTLRGLGQLSVLDGSTVSKTVNAALHAGLHGGATIDNGTGTPINLGGGDITIDVAHASDLLEDPIPSGAIAVSATAFTSALGDLDNIDPSNPQAMLSLILSGLSAVLAQVDTAGGAFDTALPVLGKSPKELFSQLSSAKRAIDELNGAPGPQLNCGNAHSGATLSGNPDGVGAAGQVFCEAVLTKPLASGTTPAWTIDNGSVVTNGTDPGTVATPATQVVTFSTTTGNLVSTDHPDGYRVHLTFTDADGEHVADFPALSVPDSLQSFVNAITAKLHLPAGSIEVSKGSVDHNGTPVSALLLHVRPGLCTLDRDAATGADQCRDSDVHIATSDPRVNVPVNLNLNGVGGLAGVSGQGNLNVSLLARADLGIAIPLEAGAAPLLLGTSGLTFRAGVDSSNLGFDAKIGPLSFTVGTGVDTDPGASGVQPGAGIVKIGGGLDVGRASDTDGHAYTPAEFFGSGFGITPDVATSQDCGSGVDGTTPTPLTGFACGRFSVAFGGDYLDDVGIAFSSFTAAPTVAIPQKLLDKLASQLLSLQFILDTLNKLVGQLHDTLAGAGKNVKIPVVGNALDAGADVAARLQDVVTAIQTVASDTIGTSDHPSDFAATVQTALYNALNGMSPNLLQDNNGDSTVDSSDVSVVPDCGADDCTTAGGLTLNDLRITFRLGQGTIGVDGKSCTGGGCAAPTSIPFDVGLDGLPVRATGAILPSAGWTLLLDFGVNRSSGPYLVVNHASPEAEVGAKVQLADSSCLTDIDPNGSMGVAALDAYDTSRCLTGTLGFLGVNLRDGDGADRSSIGVHATLQLKKKGSGSGEQKLTVNDLLGGLGDARLQVSADVGLHVRVRTGIRTGESISLPSVVGILNITGALSFDTAAGASVTPPAIVFDHLYVDLGKTLTQFLGGIVKDVKRVTSPFKPIVDTLQAPLPVLTQLAALVGQPPVTMIGLLEAVSGADLSLLRSFLSLLQFVQNLPDPGSSSLLVPLGTGTGDAASRTPGDFHVDGAAAQNASTPDNVADKLLAGQASHIGGDLLHAMSGFGGGGALDPHHSTYVGDSHDASTVSTFGVRGLEFPIFSSPMNVVKVLLGQDVKLVEYHLGTLKATAGFDITFGPFFIGPVPVSVFVGGSVTLKGTFAFGYDTTGLRRVLSGASGEHLLDGLFLDDLDEQGNDIPELQLIGEVHAGAQVDLVIVKAGVEGGIELTLGLNLHDDNHDGVLHIDEIANKLSNPICLFDIEGALDFFLKFFVEFDFFFFSDRFEFEILRIRLLDFSASCSSTHPPELAHFESGGKLVLNMGSQARRDARGLDAEATDEKFTVRPVSADGTYQVTAFGLTQDFGPSSGKSGEPAVASVYADGDSGKDEIDLVEGATPADPPVKLAFTAYAHIEGGGDDDVIKAGDGNDDLWGGNSGDSASTANGNDSISGGAGDDHEYGGGGNDTLNGDLGTDTLAAGDGNDHANGGAGGDRVDGGNGNDVVDGGPGNKPKVGDGAAQIAAYDLGDTLIGGPGSDALTGGAGVDHIYGDLEDSSCGNQAVLADVNKDTVDAGDDGDFVYGGADDDQLTGGSGNDTICGNAGNDILEGDTPATSSSGGDDTLTGGSGNDVLYGRSGADTLDGSAGNDHLVGDTGDDNLIGGLGRDVLDGADGADIELGDTGTIDAGAHPSGQAARVAMAHPAANSDTDAFDCKTLTYDDKGRITQTGSGTADCINGGTGADVVFGGGGRDVIGGDDGDDYLDGGAAGDLMRGGKDADTMFGRTGTDEMYGDSGNDVMQGNEDADQIRGGLDNDVIEGNAASDVIYGDAGQDDIVGGSMAAGAADAGDTIFGGADADVIAGDNALVTKPGGNDTDDPTALARSVTRYDVGSTDTTLYGGDIIQSGDGNDRVYGQGGDDAVSGGSNKDRLWGNEGIDTIHGDDGPDLITGGSDVNATSDAGDVLYGDAGGDVMIGDNGVIAWTGAVTPDASNAAGSFGDDTMNGNDGDDQMYGELGGDTMHGDADHDYMLGDLGTVTPATSGPLLDPDGVPRATVALVSPEVGGADHMYGDGSADHMYGGYADDVMEGNAGDDYMEGNNGQDTLRGFNATVDDGIVQPTDVTDTLVMGLGDDDDILGGSSNANPDATKRDVGENLIQGNGGQDVILGDNGTVVRTANGSNTAWLQDPVMGGPARTVTLFDTSRPAAQLPLVSGGDTIQGNGGNDLGYGEAGNDTINGNDGNDVVVGNQDVDVVHGDAGEDDVVGGSLGGLATDPIPAAGQLDTGDRLYGDAGADVLAGDNARVVRTLTGDGLGWALDPITLGHARAVTLWDTERTAPATVAGNDLMLGGDQRDRMFGQAGNDTVKGNGDDDFIQGNQGSDLLEGNDGEDDIIGGNTTSGLLDGDDVIHGGGQADVAIGDNGVIDRVDKHPAGGYYYTTYQLGITSTRFVQLLDIDSTDTLVSGSDQVSGGAGVDVLFGQAKRDYVMGGTEDDYLEGNGGSDFEWGDLTRPEVVAAPPPQLTGGLPGLPAGLPLENAGDTTPESSEPQLSGVPGVHGQDDVIGGSSKAGLLDDGDFQYGNGAADFMLGDNGILNRTIVSGAYTKYVSYNPTTITRTVTRFCTTAQATCESAGRSGGDYMEGNAGDDYMWGQDGDDQQYGGTENDDMYGELGNDRMFGEDGEDAMVGDRGGITDTKQDGSKQVTATTNGPAFFNYVGLVAGQLDRRAAMDKDFGGGALLHPGYSEGGNDFMRGGRGHDSMHGEAGNDLMNGDSGGDWLFGDDGGDVMWGGKGSDNVATPNARSETGTPNAAIGYATDNLVDYLFGGYGGDAASPGAEFTGGSDILDWRPRPGVDPAPWFEITDTANDNSLVPSTLLDNQHHQGIDWMYGGFDRDVFQGDVGKNGPDFGDRLMDWDGNFNLYSRCNSSYGDDGDIRQHSPALQNFLQTLAYGSGAGPSLAEMADPNRIPTGAHELALVYPGDKGNNGKPYPTSPGHFDQNACTTP